MGQFGNSSLLLRFNGVPLYAVIHEKLGYDEFLPFFAEGKGVYFDPEKMFYGPEQRWLSLGKGFLKASTWKNAWNTRDTKGNFEVS